MPKNNALTRRDFAVGAVAVAAGAAFLRRRTLRTEDRAAERSAPPPDVTLPQMPLLPKPIPRWLVRDLSLNASWLPEEVRAVGLNGAFKRRWNALPDDIQEILVKMDIPSWQIALISNEPDTETEIHKQFRYMANLAGAPPRSRLAQRAEQILLFAGAAQLPTPGDRITGRSLGDEGCSAAISHYVLAQLKAEFPLALRNMDARLTDSQSSTEMKALLKLASSRGPVGYTYKAFDKLTAGDFGPGSITIAEKPKGTHVFAWTRVPRAWGWNPGDTIAIGNSGLAQYGHRMVLAQEYVAPAKEMLHNSHGPLNQAGVDVGRDADPADPRTNVYAVKKSQFFLVTLNA